MNDQNVRILLDHPYKILKWTFVIMPIAAGADKFMNLLTDWKQYLDPGFVRFIPFSADIFMMIVGGIEIIAGLIVLKKPQTGGYIVAGWLALIALTLLGGLHFMDVAVRDLVMAIAAFVMARLSKIVE